MGELKRIDNPGQFLMDTGLLFEINRRILHPLGLALEVVVYEDGGCRIGEIWDFRDESDGMCFQEGEAFDGGLVKWERFRREFADAKIAQRKKILGYVVQGEKRSWWRRWR